MYILGVVIPFFMLLANSRTSCSSGHISFSFMPNLSLPCSKVGMCEYMYVLSDFKEEFPMSRTLNISVNLL